METEDISCADARSAVREVLKEMSRGLPQPQMQRLRDDALLVASELTANALLHAGHLTHFSARLTGDEIELRVGDASTEVPRRQPAAPGRPGGHGWMVVQRLCSRLDVVVEPDGKTIVAALELP
ncbi:ATP-binding protein [Streptomyces sp. p1417]|uniref:ATP-binding protein n=1 Tax=Streptomyces typhae TaxID=2681492 RepID=A0A6L6WX37_9ACTN|nr:ATP-binding protein [Streptomyces typhae]MVO85516.1 ATP-binding protein [Streptomyces typhae]